MISKETQEAIRRLEEMSKQGESYDHKGRHGWRNPIRGDTGLLLHALALAKAPSRILEIGTAHGLSGMYLASTAPMVTIEWDEETAREAQRNFDEAGLDVQVKCGDAMSIIPTLDGGPFDLVFLDANKDGYLEQVRALQTHSLLAPNCLILADNVTDRASEMTDFLEAMKEIGAVILPTECGLLVATL